MLTELQKIKALDAGPSAQFGGSVSVSKRFAIIGAWGAASGLGSPGAAYIFVRDNNDTPADPSDDEWRQQAKLLADDGASGELFGWSVSVSGDYAIAGARRHAFPTWHGAAYVFRLNDNGTPLYPDDDTWVQEAKLTAGDAQQSDELGMSVAISGDRAVAGAPRSDDAGDESGSAYVFRRDDNGTPDDRSDDFWVQESKLTASDAAAGAMFGFAVDIHAETAVIGAWHDNSAGAESGSAYVFRKDDNNTPTDQRDDFWVEEDKIVPYDGAIYDNFGFAVAVDRDRTVIGSWLDDDDGSHSGSAYVYRRDDNGTPTIRDDDFWVFEDKLTASDAGAGDEFGKAVAIDGTTIAVGSYEDDDACPADPNCDSGSAYVFRLDDAGTPLDPSDDSWIESLKLLASDTNAQDFYGRVGLNGGFLIAGSLDSASGDAAGAGYTYYVDGDCTSLVNFADLQACFTDEEGGVLPGCEPLNFDGDDDVDLGDLRRLLLTFTGP